MNRFPTPPHTHTHYTHTSIYLKKTFEKYMKKIYIHFWGRSKVDSLSSFHPRACVFCALNALLRMKATLIGLRTDVGTHNLMCSLGLVWLSDASFCFVCEDTNVTWDLYCMNYIVGFLFVILASAFDWHAIGNWQCIEGFWLDKGGELLQKKHTAYNYCEMLAIYPNKIVCHWSTL